MDLLTTLVVSVFGLLGTGITAFTAFRMGLKKADAEAKTESATAKKSELESVDIAIGIYRRGFEEKDSQLEKAMNQVGIVLEQNSSIISQNSHLISQNTSLLENQEALMKRIGALENEVKIWKNEHS